jgi:hypothetical protein
MLPKNASLESKKQFIQEQLNMVRRQKDLLKQQQQQQQTKSVKCSAIPPIPPLLSSQTTSSSLTKHQRNHNKNSNQEVSMLNQHELSTIKEVDTPMSERNLKLNVSSSTNNNNNNNNNNNSSINNSKTLKNSNVTSNNSVFNDVSSLAVTNSRLENISKFNNDSKSNKELKNDSTDLFSNDSTNSSQIDNNDSLLKSSTPPIKLPPSKNRINEDFVTSKSTVNSTPLLSIESIRRKQMQLFNVPLFDSSLNSSSSFISNNKQDQNETIKSSNRNSTRNSSSIINEDSTYITNMSAISTSSQQRRTSLNEKANKFQNPKEVDVNLDNSCDFTSKVLHPDFKITLQHSNSAEKMSKKSFNNLNTNNNNSNDDSNTILTHSSMVSLASSSGTSIKQHKKWFDILASTDEDTDDISLSINPKNNKPVNLSLSQHELPTEMGRTSLNFKNLSINNDSRRSSSSSSTSSDNMVDLKPTKPLLNNNHLKNQITESNNNNNSSMNCLSNSTKTSGIFDKFLQNYSDAGMSVIDEPEISFASFCSTTNEIDLKSNMSRSVMPQITTANNNKSSNSSTTTSETITSYSEVIQRQQLSDHFAGISPIDQNLIIQQR